MWALNRATNRPGHDGDTNEDVGGQETHQAVLGLLKRKAGWSGVWAAQLYCHGPQETKRQLLTKLAQMGLVAALVLTVAVDVTFNAEPTKDTDPDSVTQATNAVMAIVAVSSVFIVAMCTLFSNALDNLSSDDVSITHSIIECKWYINLPEQILSTITMPSFLVAIYLKIADSHGAGSPAFISSVVLGVLLIVPLVLGNRKFVAAGKPGIFRVEALITDTPARPAPTVFAEN